MAFLWPNHQLLDAGEAKGFADKNRFHLMKILLVQNGWDVFGQVVTIVGKSIVFASEK